MLFHVLDARVVLVRVHETAYIVHVVVLVRVHETALLAHDPVVAAHRLFVVLRVLEKVGGTFGESDPLMPDVFALYHLHVFLFPPAPPALFFARISSHFLSCLKRPNI